MLSVRPGPYTLREMAELAGVTDHTARNWRALDLLPLPSIDAPARGGRPAQYGAGEATVMAVLGACSHQGVGRKQLAAVSRELRIEVENARVAQRGFTGLVVVDVPGPAVRLLEPDAPVAGVLGHWGAVVVSLQVDPPAGVA